MLFLNNFRKKIQPSASASASATFSNLRREFGQNIIYIDTFAYFSFGIFVLILGPLLSGEKVEMYSIKLKKKSHS